MQQQLHIRSRSLTLQVTYHLLMLKLAVHALTTLGLERSIMVLFLTGWAATEKHLKHEISRCKPQCFASNMQ